MHSSPTLTGAKENPEGTKKILSVIFFKRICKFAKRCKMKKNGGFVFLFLFFTIVVCFSQELIPQFDKTVTFLNVYNNGKYNPYGTGFLVSIPAKTQQGDYIYLVTAKHVLQTNKKLLKNIFARFNTKDSSEMFNVPLIWSGASKTVFTHSDSTVDIAVIPIVVPSNLDYKHIPISQIGKRSEFDSLHINVGTELFFTGLFTAYTGTKLINPIFRFGRLCLIPKERIEFDGIYRELLLIESSTFGGNSGSPVIFYFQYGNSVNVRLAGVVLGGFNQGQVLGKSKDQDIVTWSSLGISAVTPSEFIIEILNSIELLKKRK